MKIVTSFLVCFLVSMSLFANSTDNMCLLGCRTTFDFGAPSVAGVSTVPAPQLGQVVFDSLLGDFMGFGGNGYWHSLSGRKSIRAVSTAGAITISDDIVHVAPSSFFFTMTLPPVASVPGKEIIIKRINHNFGHMLIVDGYSTETINGSSNTILYTEGETVILVSTGSSWVIKQRFGIVTEWKNETVSTSWDPGATSEVRWRRVGDTMEGTLRVTYNSAVSGNLTVNLPNGISIDSNKIPGNYLFYALGLGMLNDNNTSDKYPLMITMESPFELGVKFTSAGKLVPVTHLAPVTQAASDTVMARFSFPVTGWKTN